MLQKVRKAKGLSQSQLAKLAGVPVKTIQKYESGERDINKGQALIVYKLSNALGVQISEILNIERGNER